MQSNRGGLDNYCAPDTLVDWRYDAQGYSFFENFHSIAQRGTILWQPPWSWRPSAVLFIGDAVSFVALLWASGSGSNTNPQYWACPINRFALIWVAIGDFGVIIGNSTATLYFVFNRPVVRVSTPESCLP